MSTENEVRQACDQYYTALNHLLNGDAELMMEVWSHSSDVTVMHPVAGLPVGWEQVRASWEQFAQRWEDEVMACLKQHLVRKN